MDLRFAATAFATAFTIIDPVGMIPLALAVTADVDPRTRAAIADRAVIIAGIIILVMGLVGRALLDYLGITLPAFTIAGGVLLFLIAIDMLFARRPGTKQTDDEEREARISRTPRCFRSRFR
jgi:multiple antibiotic resistance protein